MANLLKRILGMIQVEEKGHEIRILGVGTRMLLRDMMKLWSTSKVESNMFSRASNDAIIFNRFFAPDVLYILETILHSKRAWSKKKDIQKAIDELRENTWLRQLVVEPETTLDRSKLSQFRKTPLPHQQDFFSIYEQRTQQYGLQGYLLSAAAGSGKTLTCLMMAAMVHSDFVVMIVPKNSVHKVWSKTLNEEFDKPQEHWIAADGKPYSGQRFLIAHYEALDKVKNLTSHLHGKVTVILDESHNMNEMTSNRTLAFIQLCKDVKSENVLWSSGTPLKAMGYEVIPLLRTIDPMFDADTERRFKAIYGRSAQRALDILRNRMGMISHRVEKKDVVDNKASSRVIRVKIPNAKEYTLDAVREEMQEFIEQRLKYYKKNFDNFEEIYNEAIDIFEDTIETSEEKRGLAMYKTYIKTLRKGYEPELHKEEVMYCNKFELATIMPTLPRDLKEQFKHARSVIKYVELKVMGEALGGVLGKKRAQCHIDMIPYMKLEDIVEDAAKKTVIFTSFVKVVQGLEEYFKKLDYKPVVIYGDTNSNLTGLITQFEQQQDANPAIATYQSLSTAVPLIVANVAVFVNSPFRDHEKVQAQARVDRLGQDTPVVFVDVFLDTGADANISTRSRDILEWSKEQVAAIMGNDYSGGAAKQLEGVYLGNESLDEAYSYYEYNTNLENVLTDLQDESLDVSFEKLMDRSQRKEGIGRKLLIGAIGLFAYIPEHTYDKEDVDQAIVAKYLKHPDILKLIDDWVLEPKQEYVEKLIAANRVIRSIQPVGNYPKLYRGFSPTNTDQERLGLNVKTWWGGEKGKKAQPGAKFKAASERALSFTHHKATASKFGNYVVSIDPNHYRDHLLDISYELCYAIMQNDPATKDRKFPYYVSYGELILLPTGKEIEFTIESVK